MPGIARHCFFFFETVESALIQNSKVRQEVKSRPLEFQASTRTAPLPTPLCVETKRDCQTRISHKDGSLEQTIDHHYHASKATVLYLFGANNHTISREDILSPPSQKISNLVSTVAHNKTHKILDFACTSRYALRRPPSVYLGVQR